MRSLSRPNFSRKLTFFLIFTYWGPKTSVFLGERDGLSFLLTRGIFIPMKKKVSGTSSVSWSPSPEEEEEL